MALWLPQYLLRLFSDTPLIPNQDYRYPTCKTTLEPWDYFTLVCLISLTQKEGVPSHQEKSSPWKEEMLLQRDPKAKTQARPDSISPSGSTSSSATVQVPFTSASTPPPQAPFTGALTLLTPHSRPSLSASGDKPPFEFHSCTPSQTRNSAFPTGENSNMEGGDAPAVYAQGKYPSPPAPNSTSFTSSSASGSNSFEYSQPCFSFTSSGPGSPTTPQAPLADDSAFPVNVKPSDTLTLLSPSLNELTKAIQEVKDQKRHPGPGSSATSYLLGKQLNPELFELNGSPRSPSLVLEVGVSESYNRLVQDVRWWGANAPTCPGLVVIVSVRRGPPFRVDFEVWTPSTTLRHHGTRDSLPPMTLAQLVRVENNVVHGGPLRLNFAALMRRPSNLPIESDILFTNDDLLFMAERHY
ncbi:unnamed protein product [Penicillium salamii]|nr:unnamed protein product [Penicillium salamii]CAG8271469.1 unnamed protein product [Penicillium salamii]CAG8428267.1 unnamed protein product [Penicillium salamii]